MAIFTYAKSNIENIYSFEKDVDIANNTFIDTKIYIYNMGQNKYFAGDIEMQVHVLSFE